MPEPTEPVPQPSFTSSTYRAIAAGGALIPMGDRPLSEQSQIQSFLNAANQCPVSEILLYRLLAIAELALENKFSDIQMGGLCLGYYLSNKRDPSEEIPDFYYVAWGWNDTYALLMGAIERLATEISDEEPVTNLSEEDSRSRDPLESELVALSEVFELEIIGRLPVEFLEEYSVSAFLFGHVKDDFLPDFSFVEEMDQGELAELSGELSPFVRAIGKTPCHTCGRNKKPNPKGPSRPCISCGS